jgi:hypothetical protein
MKSKLILAAALVLAITITASERSSGKTCWVNAHDVVCVPTGTLDDWDYTDGIEGWDDCWDSAESEESWDYDYVYTSADATMPAVESIEQHSPPSLNGNWGTVPSLANTEVPTELHYPDPDDCTQTDILPDYGISGILCMGTKEDTFSGNCNATM